MAHKLAVVVPYRDRKPHLERFIPHMQKFLQQYDFHIFIIEQRDSKLFNRAALLNIGCKLAMEQGFDYFALHDVDTLPSSHTIDYSFPNLPRHLYGAKHTAGGVLLINSSDYIKCNGMSNQYFGYGREDVDLKKRLEIVGISLDQSQQTERVESDNQNDLEVSGWIVLPHKMAFVYNENRFTPEEIMGLEKGTINHEFAIDRAQKSENWITYKKFEANPDQMKEDGLNSLTYKQTLSITQGNITTVGVEL